MNNKNIIKLQRTYKETKFIIKQAIYGNTKVLLLYD